MVNEIEYVLLDRLASEADQCESVCQEAASYLWAAQADLHDAKVALNDFGAMQTGADHVDAVAEYLRRLNECSRRANSYLIKLEELGQAKARQDAYRDEVEQIEARRQVAAISAQERAVEDVQTPLWS